MAVYDLRRGAEHQKLIKCAMEDSAQLAMPESLVVDGNADSKQYARS